MNTVTELRLAIQARGFSPIPVCGKKPLLPVWQTKAGADAAEIIAWGSFPEWPNTGILTEYTPAADIDIRHSEAAMRVEDVARERFGSYGTFLTRFGEVPKRCVLFRTDTPFAKIAAHFRAPDGSTHKIEILCGGQQVVVAGIHPDTKKPYSWHADRGPWSVSRDDLPEIDESEARAFVEQAAAVLEKEFEFVRIYPGGNGHTPAGEREPVNVGGEFAAMTDGASVNDAQCRIIPSRLRAGEHPDDVLQLVVDGTMAATGNKLGWSRR